METKIVSFSGKLCSGKTSASNFVASIAFMNIIRDKDGNPLTDRAWVDENGRLQVNTTEGEQELNLHSKSPEVVQWLDENVHPYLKFFSHADKLKEFAVDVLGLNPDHVYGTQEDKKQLSHIAWENMAGYAQPKKTKSLNLMTVREVLEYFGTDIVRRISPNGWAKSSIKSVLQFNPLIAVNDDTRFEDEVEAVKAVGGKVIRLTRTTEEAAKNTHKSNTALDNVDPAIFDAVIDNQNLSLQEMFAELIKILENWEWLQKTESE